MTEVHVGGLEDLGAVKGYRGEGVEAGEDEVGESCGFGRDGDLEAVEPGLFGDPLDREFVCVEEGIGDALERFGLVSLWVSWSLGTAVHTCCSPEGRRGLDWALC